MNPSSVLSRETLDEIRRLLPEDFAGRRMTSAEFTHIAGLAGGYYEHGAPRPSAPHMLLNSGLHSGYYVDCSAILAVTNVCQILASQIIRYCLADAGRIDWVVSAALAGIPLGQEIGRQLRVSAGYVEKGRDGELSEWRFEIPRGSRVLLVNELITTPGGTALKTKQTVQTKNGEPVEFLPFGAFMVDRCDKSTTMTDGTEIRGLFKLDFPTYPPNKEECPYCQVGSPVLNGKPALRQYWREQSASQQASHRQCEAGDDGP